MIPPLELAFTDEDRAALAPTGVLRTMINLGNPLLARQAAGDPQPHGVSVDLARGLAELLGVPVALSVVDGAAKSVAAVAAGDADVGFFAVDPGRAQGVRFTAPYLLIEGAYLVRDDSPLRDNAKVDAPGHRVAVGAGSAYDLFLSRHLTRAEIVRAPTSADVVPLFVAQGLDVAAGVRQPLQAEAERVGGLRLLPGRFMVIEQAMGLPAARGERAAKALDAFIASVKAARFVEEALRRHGIDGATVAP